MESTEFRVLTTLTLSFDRKTASETREVECTEEKL